MWASAKVRDKVSLHELEAAASSCFFSFSGNPKNPALRTIDFWWCDKNVICFDQFKTGLVEHLVFQRRLESISVGIENLSKERRECLCIEWSGTAFEVTIFRRSSFVEFFISRKDGAEGLVSLFETMNFLPTYDGGNFETHSNAWVPIGGKLHGLSPSSVYWTVNELTFPAHFEDSTYKQPTALSYFIPIDLTNKAINILIQLAKDFGDEISLVTLSDRPLDCKPSAPLLDGTWDIRYLASYKSESYPLDRPTNLGSSVRYPLIQNKETLASGGFKELHWQIDIVHTPTESFFDVQTSRGQEYLLEFLKEHQMEGEIWPDRFEGRL